MVFPIRITITEEVNEPELIEFNIFARKIGRDTNIDNDFVSNMSIEPAIDEEEPGETEVN